ncbi:SpoIID/LytB domain-containing protein [bacterium]|nr:SpoIID/LytB domain-containing protein [Candidatus Omnitrophota bacterium]MBU2528167.1 SpoIID/LytB domain-containing protein [bacterium]MBU3929545.1 SpoIID/LytB domain-containing protein [bacterium]MBU4122165.1 SpoIID/LytB domain-containing protein [bacterium]
MRHNFSWFGTIKRIRTVPILFVTAYFLPAFLCARDPQIITILIERNQKSVNISSPDGMTAADMQTGRRVLFPKGSSYRAEPSGGGVKIRGEMFGAMVRLIPAGESVKLNGRAFRDSIILQNEASLLSAINEIGVESYLCGVLPRELSPSWDEEALKAQAVVSRTYIMANLGRFSKQGYDLTACENSQVYGGLDCEQGSTSEAVRATAGEVIKYRGDIARVYFHADAAGHTESPEFVWGSSSPPPYLKGKREPVRKDTPYSSWEYETSFEDISRVFEKNGYKTGVIKRVVIKNKTPSGRVKNFMVYSASGKTEIKSGKFRTMLGGRNIKSTKINKIINGRKSVVFTGAGWGHGVGMSQWGAKELAEKGWDYKKILRLYFPGTGIAKY